MGTLRGKAAHRGAERAGNRGSLSHSLRTRRDEGRLGLLFGAPLRIPRSRALSIHLTTHLKGFYLRSAALRGRACRWGRRSAPPPCWCGPSAYTVRSHAVLPRSLMREGSRKSLHILALASVPRERHLRGRGRAPLTPEGARRLAASHAASTSAPLGAGPRREGASLAASASYPLVNPLGGPGDG